MYKNWSQAMKRYQARVAISMVGYIVVLVGVDWLFRNMPPEGPLKYALAVLPALPIIAVLAAMGAYVVEETDEFQRAQTVERILVATGLTLAITTGWGFLENFAGLAHMELYFVAVIWFAGFGLANLWTAWRYR